MSFQCQDNHPYLDLYFQRYRHSSDDENFEGFCCVFMVLPPQDLHQEARQKIWTQLRRLQPSVIMIARMINPQGLAVSDIVKEYMITSSKPTNSVNHSLFLLMVIILKWLRLSISSPRSSLDGFQLKKIYPSIMFDVPSSMIQENNKLISLGIFEDTLCPFDLCLTSKSSYLDIL